MAAARGMLPHAIGGRVKAAYGEARPDEILGEGGSKQTHADQRDRSTHVEIP
jgi:hypothetical protein